MMKKSEKWFMITLFSVLIVCFVFIPIGKGVYRLYENRNHKKLAETWKYENVFKAVEVPYKGHVNSNEKGYMKKPNLINTDNIVIDETMLQIKINAYNNYFENEKNPFEEIVNKKLDLKTIKKEFDYFIETDGVINDKLHDFVLWCSSTSATVVPYSDKLDQLLSLYKTIHKSEQELVKLTLKRLTTEQINKLDEVYRGEKTIEEIEL